MPKSEYSIIDDFQIKNLRVLVLDSDYEIGHFKKAMIDGKLFSYELNSIRSWVVIKSDESFKGKRITFLRQKDLDALDESMAG